MKIRTDFVTNSSSSSFVLCKAELQEKHIRYIEQYFEWIDIEDLMRMCRRGSVDDVYYLVDYDPADDYMHIWVRRDEAMYDNKIDDVLYEYDTGDIPPKFDYHY